MRNNKNIPESIRDVILQQGQDVVKDSRLSSILNDVASYDDAPAAKVVLRTILKNGYGARLLEVGGATNEWKLRVRSYAAEIANNFGYQPELVDFLLNSIAYGLGWTDTSPSLESVQQSIKRKANAAKEYAITDLKGELANQQKEYLRLLQQLLVVPDKTSAYYPTSALTQLELVEGKIRLLCEALNISDKGWCRQEKQKILQAHYKDTSSLKTKAYTAVGAGAFLLVVGAGFGTNYVSSMDDMESFSQSIQEGDNNMASGLYDEAFSSYKAAYTNYNAFNANSYKQEAFDKISVTVDKMIEAGKTDNNSLSCAHNAIQEALLLDISTSDKMDLQAKLEVVEADITTRIENGTNTLALNISANDGKLNDDGRKLLEELLELSPNDYWLNFIKNKEQ